MKTPHTPTPSNPMESSDTKAYFAWKASTLLTKERTPEVKFGWDAACEYKDRENAKLKNCHDELLAALKELLSAVTSKAAPDTTCPIAWSGSPDQNRRMYASIDLARAAIAKSEDAK